jgi:L-aminopeptidase/D-esterase-like protein
MENAFKIGHYSDIQKVTGCTVILCPENAVASCYINGSAPGSREIALLEPEKKIQHIHGLLLTGGSAFGLGATEGVVRFLEERGIGYETPFAKVPLVPAAVIYDLYLGHPSGRPSADNAYRACKDAKSTFSEQGNIGVGTGATVGKWAGLEHSMKGGLGIAEEHFRDLWVRSVVVVNSVGDIIDNNGQIVAGAIDSNKKFLAQTGRQNRLHLQETGFGQNTVLSVILTNAQLTKIEAYVLSKRATAGLARSIYPVSTSYDGDIVFVISSGEIKTEIDLVTELSTEALRRGVISGVYNASRIDGCLAVADLEI